MSEALYRKYRPSNFEEVFGQHHIKTILTNALKKNEVAHAYMFAGPHGTGKTSVARILAKELGVAGVDLIEIDAASHRGIDDVREIRESVNYQPSQSQYKLYILDEAHMLTNEAFNALLKTLEEPPKHAYFVLCTTEAHKIPLTILSRCQRLNFEAAQNEELAQYMQKIAKAEGYTLPENALQILIDNTSGSFRDATVALASAMQFVSDTEISPEVFEKELGFYSTESIGQLLDLITQKDGSGFVDRLKDLSSTSGATGRIVDTLITQASRRIVASGGSNADNSKNDPISIISLMEHLLEARRKMLYVDDSRIPFTVEVLKWMNRGNEEITVKSEKSVETQKKDVSVTTSNKNVDEAKIAVKETAAVSKSVEVKPQVSSASQPSSESKESRPASSASEPVDTSNVSSMWSQVMAIVKEQKRSVEALLKAAEVGEMDDSSLTLHFAYDFHKTKVEETENKRLVEEILSNHVGKNVRLRCMLKSEKNVEKRQDVYDTADDLDDVLADTFVTEDDLIKKAQEVFGGQLIE